MKRASSTISPEEFFTVRTHRWLTVQCYRQTGNWALSEDVASEVLCKMYSMFMSGEGLWWSGLRRSEAWHLHWADERMIRVDLSGKFPMFRINPEADKGFEARTFPIAPQFAEMLAKTPKSQRTGYVFNPLSVRSGGRVTHEQMSRIIGRIGEKSGIVVSEARGKQKFVTAHDLRRSFGTRWSTLVIPAVLQKLMRHAEIATTMQFYVTGNAENTAESVWAAAGVTLGITNKKETHKESLKIDVNPYG